MSYTYDDLCRVCNRRTADLNTGEITNESFTLDAAGNILDDDNFEYYYTANNQLQECTEYCLEYDEDGNMTYSFVNYEDTYYTFDSRNRLVSDGTHTYTYNAENTRIRSTCDGVTTYYTYNTNAKLSQLLHKQTQGVVAKYVYGVGLIGEEKQGEFKTYHFDYRGSTAAITDKNGAITDTFRYDTYGKLISRTGETDTPFLFNGRDGVMTEANGLYYMRARYYSPELRRFINADIVAGENSNSPALNRYAYANGNPVSNIDPLGLSAERDMINLEKYNHEFNKWLQKALNEFSKLPSFSFGANMILYTDATTTITYLSEFTLGSGDFNVQHTFSDQLETLASFTFPNEISAQNVKIQSDGSISFEYTVPVDDYNEVIVGFSTTGNQINYSYSINTLDNMNNSMSTGIEATYRLLPTDSSKPYALEVVGDWAMTLALAGVAAFAIVETVGTLGAGIWNDGIAIGGFLAKLGETISNTGRAFA